MREKIRAALKSALERISAAKSTVRSRLGASSTSQARRDWPAIIIVFLMVVMGGFFGGLMASLLLRAFR